MLITNVIVQCYLSWLATPVAQWKWLLPELMIALIYWFNRKPAVLTNQQVVEIGIIITIWWPLATQRSNFGWFWHKKMPGGHRCHPSKMIYKETDPSQGIWLAKSAGQSCQVAAEAGLTVVTKQTCAMELWANKVFWWN